MQLLIRLILVFIISFSLSSCSSSNSSNSDNNGNNNNNPPPTNTTNPNNNNQSTSNNTNQNNNNNSNSTNNNNTNNTNTTDGNFSMGDDYVLPPMPGIFEKNKDLLGVDTNNNQVRDDVEHYIYNRFQGYKNSRVEREIAMQWARVAQLLIQSPETAYEDGKHELSHRAVDCQFYYYDAYFGDNSTYAYEEWLRYSIEHNVIDTELDDAIFNTRERLKAYFRYNEDMSGHVFSLTPKTKYNCDFDIKSIIEGRL